MTTFSVGSDRIATMPALAARLLAGAEDAIDAVPASQ
jgi:hypothetical protein